MAERELPSVVDEHVRVGLRDAAHDAEELLHLRVARDQTVEDLDVVRRRLPDLPEREQRLGRRIVDARVHYSEGLRRLSAREPLGAAREFVKLTRAPLGMLASPLFRQQMVTHLGRLARA